MIKEFIFAHRLIAKRIVAIVVAALPAVIASKIRAAVEQIAFRVVPMHQADTLPNIFHYWSQGHLAPNLTQYGYASPEDFYLSEITQSARGSERPLRVASLGSGDCSLELDLCRQLTGDGHEVHFHCIDFNAELLEHARRRAEIMGLAHLMSFEIQDCNKYFSTARKDVVMVNQFFHHVEELEIFCGSIKGFLADEGKVLTCDLVGRNGHVLWPAVNTVVQAFFHQLPSEKRFDRYFGAPKPVYVSVNHAKYSNEGIRAQDVVSVLAANFDFELFLTYGAAIMPFIERRLGHNFSPNLAEDREFIDRVANLDEAHLAARSYPASNMLAVLRNTGRARDPKFLPISPQVHIELSR